VYKGAPHGLYTTHKGERERRPARVLEGLRLNDWPGSLLEMSTYSNFRKEML